MKQVDQSSSYKSAYRLEIDGLRAVAVLGVVVFHFFPHLLTYGYLGVDIFFVISGFLISTHLLNVESKNIRAALQSFYKRRIKRLFPALFLFLALTHIFISNFFLSVDVRKFEVSLFASYTFWANFYFWRDGGYFGGSDQLKPLLHIWSLSVEEQFYLLFPIFLLASVKLRRFLRFSAEFAVLLITVSSFGLWLFLNHVGGSNPAFFLLPTRIWQFAIGASLAVTASKDFWHMIPAILSRFFFLAGVIAIATAFLLNIDAKLQTVLVTMGAAGFIAFSKAQDNFLVSAFRSSILVFFGKISYSLYLYHWPIAVALIYYFVDGVPVFFAAIGVVLSVAFSFLSFKFIESPFRYQFKFNYTLYFLTLCLFLSALVYLLTPSNAPNRLADIIAQASGTHFRCEMFSYRPYGSSRACAIKTTEAANGVVALMGNSHAQMYTPMVSEVIPKNLDLLLLPLNGCLPTTSINISQTCLTMAKTNLDAVLSDADVNVIVLGTTWYSDSYVDVSGNQADQAALRDSVGDLVNQIRKGGKFPILLSPLAIPKKDYASELARKLRFNHLSAQEALKKFKVSRSAYDHEFDDINSHFKMLMGEAYIRVYDDLCDSNYCFFGREDLFYFADSNHLSQNAFSSFDKSNAQLQSVFLAFE